MCVPACRPILSQALCGRGFSFRLRRRHAFLTAIKGLPHPEPCMGSFLSTGFVQGGFLFWSRLREVGAVGKGPARATAKSLAAAGHLSTAVGVVSARQDLIAGCRGRTEGSPAVGATIAPQPCIRWSRRGLLAMKQSYASG